MGVLVSPAISLAGASSAKVQHKGKHMMKYVSMAAVGLIVGVLARFVYPGPVELGWIMSAVLGVAGSFLAGFAGSMLDKEPGTQLKPAGFLWSVLGAVLLIFIGRMAGFA